MGGACSMNEETRTACRLLWERQICRCMDNIEMDLEDGMLWYGLH
jgi:hypothetical protein